MGWDSCRSWKTKADVVLTLKTDYLSSTVYEYVESKSTTHGLWTVLKNRETGKKVIVFDLIKKERGEFMVKNMDEGMGPYYYDCPSKFVYDVPESKSGNFNRAWRERYFAANAGKKGFPRDLISIGVGR